MAMEQGALTIVVTNSGATIPMGSGGHTVTGNNSVQALIDAYGKRIGKVVYQDGTEKVINEYKENPVGDYNPDDLKDTGKVVKIKSGPKAGEYAVKYADGTYSYTGTGTEGLQEASRQYNRAKQYNDFLKDGRTRADFDTDNQYNSYLIVKSIRMAQGTLSYKTDENGLTTLYGPKGVKLAEGELADIRKQWGSEANSLHLATRHLEQVSNSNRISANTIRYMKETQGYSSDEEVKQYMYNRYSNAYKGLAKIYQKFNTAAAEQGIDLGDKYQVSVPDYQTFLQTLDYGFDDGMSYSDFLKEAGITGVGASTVEQVKAEDKVEEKIGDTGVVSDVTDTTQDQMDDILSGGDDTPRADEKVDDADIASPEADVIGADTPSGESPIDPITGTYETVDTAGTFTTPTTVTDSAIDMPEIGDTMPNYTGTTIEDLTSTSQGGFGGTVKYTKPSTGQVIFVTTDSSGNPITYVPPGFQKDTSSTGAARGGAIGMSEGGDVEIARKLLDFDGPASQLENFLAANPQAAARMGKYRKAMVGMSNKRMGASGGTDAAEGTGDEYTNIGAGNISPEQMATMSSDLVSQTMQPVQSTVAQITPETEDFIASDAGQTEAAAPTQEATKVENVTLADTPVATTAATVDPALSTAEVKKQTEALEAAQGDVSAQAQVDAAQQEESSVSQLKAEQGTAIMMDNPVQREIQDGELISGAANAAKASEFTEQIEAATAEPSTKATVRGQLEDLMADFEGGETPAWAGGAMRQAMASLAARGLSSSSMAGQAVIQAAMEAALPIAQTDAATQAQFESQNLSNRQQRAMLAAQQRADFLKIEFDQEFQARVQNSARIGDIANMNFTAEQQIALENSRAANTMELTNLSNKQALVMAEAAALANLDMANLNNRQQAAVQNAQAFLQMDMANLNNEQQTAIFKAQQNIQALFTDQAAENAAAQFNASSENQTNQFFASLTAQVGQFNAAQTNAVEQFNVNSVNALKEFNANLQQQRDMFNAQNGLVIAQANAQWRQNIATLNTAAQNESNMAFAQTINALTSTNLDQIWQRERDIMSFAFTANESGMDRALQVVLADKELAAVKAKISSDDKTAKAALWTKVLFGI
jgi:hypothetical protein